MPMYLVHVDRHVVLGLLVADISAAIDVSELVDVRRSELAGRDLVLEEKVELGVGASLWLRKADMRPKIGTVEKEAGENDASWCEGGLLCLVFTLSCHCLIAFISYGHTQLV